MINYNMNDNSPFYLIPGEKTFNDNWNPVFIHDDSKSVWILIIDNLPIMRSEFNYVLNDKEVEIFNRDGYGFYIKNNNE